MSLSSRVTRHLRNNVVGYVALFFALTMGTAYATHPGGTNTISSGDIINGEVRGADIAAGAVGTGRIVPGAVTDTRLADDAITRPKILNGAVNSPKVANHSIHSVDLANTVGDTDASTFVTGSGSPVAAPDGPSVTARVPAGAIAVVYARADIDATGSDLGSCTVFVNMPGVGDLQVMARSSGAPPFLLHSNPQFREPSPGNAQTFELRYQVNGTDGDDTCSFGNRALWVQVIGG